MSALAAAWSHTADDQAARVCGDLLDIQAALGPDGRDLCDAGPVALGRRLWRLLPEDDFDRQPMRDPDSGLVMVCDVRLDDRAAHARAFAIDGAIARLSDAALVFEAWRRHGIDCVDGLYGSFAIVAWEPARARMVLVRDHLGTRPLFLRRLPDRLLVASQARALAAVPGIARAPVDMAALVDRLALVAGPATRTLMAGIEVVPPASIAIANGDGLEIRRWWRAEAIPQVRWRRSADQVDAAREAFDRAVASCLRARVPVGAHLSAGYDSGAVAVTAAGMLARSGRRLTAFTAVPVAGAPAIRGAGRLTDEGELAALTARQCGMIDHVRVDAGGRDLLADLDAWAAAGGGPYLNPSNLGWSLAIDAQARARGIGVMLNGAMGNLFLTAPGWMLLPERMLAGNLPGWLAAAVPAVLRGNAGFRSLLSGSLLALVAARWPGLLSTRAGRRLYPPQARQAVFWNGLDAQVAAAAGIDAGLSRTWDHWRTARAGDSRAMRLYSLSLSDPGPDTRTRLALSGVDHRDPMADRRLAELCIAIPQSGYLRHGRPRALARRVFAGRLPERVLAETRRGMQASDWHVHARAALPDLRDEVAALAATPALAPLLDCARFNDLLDRLDQAGAAELRALDGPVTGGLLRNIAAARFARRSLGGNF